MTIAEKRAKLFNERMLSVYSNNEAYYLSTITTGIPDGDDVEVVLNDISNGDYDDDIDEMLTMYKRVREYFVNESPSDAFYVYCDEPTVKSYNEIVEYLKSIGLWKTIINKRNK